MIKKVHDVLIYQRTYHKDIATRFSQREGFEDLVFTSKTNNPINAANIKDSINYIVEMRELGMWSAEEIQTDCQIK